MNYDFCILGAGLAGLSVAKGISDLQKCKILVLDPAGIGKGASGSPIGLINPATGRYANKTWKAEEAVKQAKQNLKDVTGSSNRIFYSESGVIRPAMELKIAERMQANIQENHWPPGWCEWLSEKEIREQYPGLNCTIGGVKVNCGITVEMPGYLTLLCKYLLKKGVNIIHGIPFNVEYQTQPQPPVFPNHESDDVSTIKKPYWIINLANGDSITADTLILTAGIKTKNFDFWKGLPLIPVKGQALVFECEDAFPFKSAVSALGYFASLDGKTLVAGSTYEHKFDHEEPDEFGEEYITKRLFKVMPELQGRVTLKARWAGVRASTPDRLPILDYHKERTNCLVLAGLGSKGLLYSSLLSKQIGQHFAFNKELPVELRLDRFS